MYAIRHVSRVFQIMRFWKSSIFHLLTFPFYYIVAVPSNFFGKIYDARCVLFVRHVLWIPRSRDKHTRFIQFSPVWLEYSSIRVEARLFATYFPCLHAPSFSTPACLFPPSHNNCTSHVTAYIINPRMHLRARSNSKVRHTCLF